MYTSGLRDQLAALKKYMAGRDGGGVTIEGRHKHIIFLSFGKAEARAFVCKGVADSWEESWQKAEMEFDKRMKRPHLDSLWLKVDVVTTVKEYPLAGFLNHVSQIKTNYFREGIAFDQRFRLAFLEQEMNGNVFLHWVKGQAVFRWDNINYYVKRNYGLNLLLGNDVVKRVYTFSTVSAFHDGSNLYPLGCDWLNNGRRYVSKLAPEILQSIICKSSQYLAGEVLKSGMFRYGYFPCFDREISHYNILRHASTTYSMIEAYEVTQSETLAAAIKLGLDYLVREIVTIDCGGVQRGFVVEKTDNNSIKLGANAAAVLALAKYIEVFSEDGYLSTIQQLARGILCFQRDDGSFVHVLNYPDLSIREAQRIVYYDGEATFALARLYSLDINPKWLKAVEQAFGYFIDNQYWRHNDHWLSYCSQELFLHRPKRKYLLFNLKNAEGVLDFCLTRETTYPTLLELLMACHKIISICKQRGMYLDIIAHFDQSKLLKAIHHRARHQLNGFMFPEVAMYFKMPKKVLGSFYIRHHAFRVRIDDVEHNLSGYCSYLQQGMSG